MGVTAVFPISAAKSKGVSRLLVPARCEDTEGVDRGELEYTKHTPRYTTAAQLMYLKRKQEFFAKDRVA